MSFLFTSLLIFVAIPVLLIVGILFLRSRYSGRSVSSAVAVARIAAWVGIGIMLIVMVPNIATLVMNEQVTVEVPVEPYWPQFPNVSDVVPDHAGSVEGTITSVMVTASNLSFASRFLLILGSLASALGSVAVLYSIILLCTKLLAASPFDKALRRSGYLAAGAVAFGGFLGQILIGIGSVRVGEETLRVEGFSYASVGEQDFPPDSLWPIPSFGMNFEFAPLFTALVILVVVELISAGMRLAQQNEALKADTDGLV